MSDSGNCDVPLPPEQGNKQNDSVIRTRIAAVLDRHKTDPYDEWTCQCDNSGTRWADHVADVVIREVLTPEYLADIIIAAVQKAADDE